MNRLLGVVFLVGCHLQPTTRRQLAAGPPTQPPATWEECARLDMSAFSWSLTSIISGALGGAGSGMVLSLDNSTAKYTVGGVSALLTFFSALGGGLTSFYSKKYADRCTNNSGGK